MSNSNKFGDGTSYAEVLLDGSPSKFRLLAHNEGAGSAWIQAGTAWVEGSKSPIVFSAIYGTPVYMTIEADGRLVMASGAQVTTGGVWTNASSREYKEDVKPLSTEDALSALEALEPVQFKYKADLTEKHVGFIAEDVPELVAHKDRKGLAAMDIVAVLTRVVKEQQKQIAALQARLEPSPV